MSTTPPTQDDKNAESQSLHESRRQFTKTAVGSAVILTLASKPVMGSTYACTGSGGMSGNTSSHGTTVSCLACSPGYWKTSPGTWPTPYYPYKICNCHGNVLHQPTKFSDAFGSGPTTTMMTILQTQNGSREWHAIGCLLNTAKALAMGLSSAYNISEIKSMYSSGAPTTTFSSTWSGSMESCPLPNSNDNYYQAEGGAVFCKVVDTDGAETTTNYTC